MRNTRLEIRRMAGAVGAEIHGVDLRQPLDDDTFGEIRQVFHDSGVIFFRDQDLSPEQHIAFAERFGPININRFFTPVAGYPQIAEVRKEPDQKKNIGETWHADHSYDQIPALGSVLLAREVPPYGGDTMFSSMVAAYEALSDGMKRTLSGMRAIHSSRHVFGAKSRAQGSELKERLLNPDLATQDALHPVVVRHPDTGRHALYVNHDFTTHFEGWTKEESQPLLDYLYKHGARPEFTCRFTWAKGSMALWDNRSTWHLAVNDYHGHRRLMHRITIEGVALQ